MRQSSTRQPDATGHMGIMEHLYELRIRLGYTVAAIALGMVVGLVLVLGPTQLVDFIIVTFAPLNPDYAPVTAVGTAETFTSFMTVALSLGLVLAMPVIIYQLLAFIAPGLNTGERRTVLRAVPFIMLLFLIGLAFGWFVTVPTAVRFLIGFTESPFIEVQPTLSDFLRIVTLLLLMNGIVFELPAIIYVMAYMGIVTAQQLSDYRRFAVVIVVVVAAVITPTGDPINLLLLAIPMYFLFELGIILARVLPTRDPAG